MTRCRSCGEERGHLLGCGFGPKTARVSSEPPYAPPCFVNGFLKLDLRAEYIAQTRRDLRLLLSKGKS